MGSFQKVGECLYRYSSNGVYYARIKLSGKEIRRSLETTDVLANARYGSDSITPIFQLLIVGFSQPPGGDTFCST
jgi:hypothetical protein